MANPPSGGPPSGGPIDTSSYDAQQEAKIEILKARNELELEYQKSLGETYEISKKQLELDIETAKNDAEKVGLTAAQRKAAAEKVAQLEEQKEAYDNIANSVAGVAGKLGMASSASETGLGKMYKSLSSILSQTGGTEAAVKQFGAQLSQTFNIINVGIAIVEKYVESLLLAAVSIDTAAKSLQRSIGISKDFYNEMYNVVDATSQSGVAFGDAAKSFTSLSNNFSAFNPYAQELNTEMSTSISLLEKLGVSADTSSKMMDHFNRVLGMTPTASKEMAIELTMAGREIGISASKMASDFEASAGDLSIYGNQSIKVFKEMEAQAKATGIAIGSLISVAKGFDTFDKAAEMAGSLNAVLGTNLSTIDMINSSYEQRIDILRRELQATIGNFDMLDPYTQMYVTQAMGLKDVSEARRLVNMSEAEYLSYNNDMQSRAETQEKLSKLTSQFTDIATELKIAMLELGIAIKPLLMLFVGLLRVVGYFITGIGQLIKLISDWADAFRILAGSAIIVAYGFLLLATSTIVLNGATVTLGISMRTFLGATGLGLALIFLPQIIDLFSNMGTGMQVLTSIVLIAAAAWALYKFASMSAWGVTGLVVIALLTLWGAFHKRGSPPLYLIAGVMALGIIALGVAAKIGGTKLLLLVVALAAMFFAVHLVIKSISGLVSVISSMFEMLINNVAILPQLALGLYLVGGAFAAFGAGVLMGAGALAMAAPLLLLAAIALAPLTAEVYLLGQAFQMIGTGMDSIANGLAAISSFKSDEEFFAITTDGTKTSVVAAKSGILASISSDTLTVDVKMPKIEVPQPIVKVYLDGDELRSVIRKEMSLMGT